MRRRGARRRAVRAGPRGRPLALPGHAPSRWATPPARRARCSAWPPRRCSGTELGGGPLQPGRASAATSSSSTSGRRGARRASPRRPSCPRSPGASATRRVTLVGVVFNDSLGAASAFAAHYGSLYPSIVDPGGAIANRYGVTSPPTTFIIDAHGRVAATLLGPVSAAQLARAVSEVLVSVLGLVPALGAWPSSRSSRSRSSWRRTARRRRRASRTSSRSCDARAARTSRWPRATPPRRSRCATRSPRASRAGESDTAILTSLEVDLRHVDPAEPADLGPRDAAVGGAGRAGDRRRSGVGVRLARRR